MAANPDLAFRRRLQIEARDARTVVAGLEDEMHHFELAVRHDGATATGFETRGVRSPWSTCDDATVELDRMVGLPLGASMTQIVARAAPREQCTHLFDLAALAVRFATRGVERVRYDATVPDFNALPFDATLTIDGDPALHWVLGRDGIESPAPFAGRKLTGGFMLWCERALAPEVVDAALVLRRAAWMAGARRIRLDDLERLSDSMLPPGSCFSSQPHRIDVALRNRGTQRDYGDGTVVLLDGFARRWGLAEDSDRSR